MTSTEYIGKHQHYRTGQRIGGGGEGDVFEVQNQHGIVLKVYKEAPDQDKADKLHFMAGMARPELLRFAAWPLDVVRDNSGRVCGFTMRKLEAYVPLHMLFSPMDRKKVFADKGYNFLVHAARNLASAFHQIHVLGIVVGDVNEANILVNNNGMIAFIDCDSFQIKNGSRYHFCEVGVPRYTPPELLIRGSFDMVVRTIDTDAFSLATLIFQLLFLGRAPFTGINRAAGDFDEELAIKQREFAYSLRRSEKKLMPAKHSLDLGGFSPDLINSFHVAFESKETRPAPAKWIHDLDELNKALKSCTVSKTHFFPQTMPRCPWCALQDVGVVAFLDDSYLGAVPELNNIEQFVNGFKLDKFEIRKLSETYPATSIKAKAVSTQYKTLKYLNHVLNALIILATLGLTFNLGTAWFVGGLVLLYLFNVLSPTKSKIKSELNRLKTGFEQLNSRFQSLVKQHNSPNDLGKYNQAAGNLTSLIAKFRGLPDEFAENQKRIEERHYEAKLNAYLERFDIENYKIPKFGEAKKQLVRSNGICNAADISKLKRIAIKGIGPANIQILTDWQRHMASGFTYSPDKHAIQYDIQLAAQQIAQKKTKYEGEIKLAYKNLLLIRANIQGAVDFLEKQYIELGPQVRQAELDYQAFEKAMKYEPIFR
jgi:DNA-binding helix-hairpin-helix protein with protein kinase domain